LPFALREWQNSTELWIPILPQELRPVGCASLRALALSDVGRDWHDPADLIGGAMFSPLSNARSPHNWRMGRCFGAVFAEKTLD
jgi:hypothetical protein